MKKIYAFIAASLLLIGCSSSDSDAEKSSFSVKKKDHETVYTTATGKKIYVQETHPKSQSKSTVQIRTEGFEHDMTMVMDNIDPITEVFHTDLDGNGFDEIILACNAVGPGSYGSIHAFASNRDKDMMSVAFPEVVAHQLEGDGDFAGYRGFDRFEALSNWLTRTWPVYRRGSEDIIGEAKTFYSLRANESGYFFALDKVERTMNAMPMANK